MLQQRHHGCCIQHLRTGIEMKTRKIHGQRRQQRQHFRRGLGINTKRPRSATHPLASTTQLDIRVDAQRHTRTHGSGLTCCRYRSQFADALALEQDIGGHASPNVLQRLTGACKTNVEAARQVTFQRYRQFTTGGHIETIDVLCQVFHQRWKRIGLHRVVQTHSGGQHGTQGGKLRVHYSRVVNIERGAPSAGRQCLPLGG